MNVLFFLFIQMVWGWDAVSLGSKVPLSPQALSYHFSDQSLVRVNQKGTHPFFIAQKQGALKYYEDQKAHRLLILSPDQHSFFKSVHPFTKNHLGLKWDIKEELLTLEGATHSLKLSQFLLSSCSGRFGIRLKVTPQPATATSSVCLGDLESVTKWELFVMVAESKNLQEWAAGLGVPKGLGWNLHRAQFILEKIKGQLTLGQERRRQDGTFYFSGEVAKELPLYYETALDVGVRSQSLLNAQAVQWKKVVTSLEAKILKEGPHQAQMEFVFKKGSRTGDQDVFGSQVLKKNLLLKEGRWQKVIQLRDTTHRQSLGGWFGLSLLGQNQELKGQTSKEVWVKTVKKEL